MPHHHVPEPKETSPVVDRLRLELNRTVRRTVAEAVDAVWIAFEDELTQMTMPPDDNYELFNTCCRRLVKFIDSNMETTPGFVEQMDRLILACHSGATGRALQSAMTKDLRIRRHNKEKNRENHVDIKTEASISDSESLANSLPSGSLDGELDIAATAVGNEEKVVDK
ncbi:Alcohol dehydrogenase [Phytophthora palmivora]|uniref:Alcohol dehydrogenase n=1 Tax=Phytophthora palmivora TaxID=4796 RepID=A0A2P4WZK6_9STRA|nr:Alcohol dehydrogenase [Phytophthora palmivora]